jgi:hypothetical protein
LSGGLNVDAVDVAVLVVLVVLCVVVGKLVAWTVGG